MRGLQDRQEPTAGWKSLAHTASTALAQLDAERLEQLSDSCQALANSPILVQDTGEILNEMAVFRRVLEATRANLEVMRRLRAMREQLEYREQSACGCGIEGE